MCLGPNSMNIYLRVIIFKKNKQDTISTTKYLRKKTERLLDCKTPFCLQPQADQRLIPAHLLCNLDALLLTFTYIISLTGHTKTYFNFFLNKLTMHFFILLIICFETCEAHVSLFVYMWPQGKILLIIWLNCVNDTILIIILSC